MPKKLLLADDSVTIQRVIELTFADEDVDVTTVGDGRQAIDRLRAERPDIVLADIGMPERDGYEVAAFIKGNPQLSHIPVLLLTGAFEPIDESRARAVGCDGVLVKPFEPQMVINRVKDLLAGRRSGVSGNAGTPAAGGGASTADEPQRAAAEPAKPADSLEDYFDRLDAAFATLGGDSPAPAPVQPAQAASPTPQAVATSASQPASAEDFASWDPDLAGDAGRPAAHSAPPVLHAAAVAPPPAPPVSVHVSVTAPPSTPYAAPTVTVTPAVAAAPAALVPLPPAPAPPPQISLAEAFATLLAAEHGQAIAPPVRTAAPPPPNVVEDIVQRVLDRLQQPDVRQTVVDVAERVVREEIARIKRANG